MVLKLGNIGRWRKLAVKDGLKLGGTDKPRAIRIEFNTSTPTRVDVLEGEWQTFLGVFDGYQSVEFIASGDVDMFFAPEGKGEVWYSTDDGDVVAYNNPAAESFTKLWTRRARNPELERMMLLMQANIDRRTASLEAELADLRTAQAAREGANPETGELPDGQVGDGTTDGTAATQSGEAAGTAAAPDEGADAGGEGGTGVSA